jgi:hypothetical protein
VQRVLGILDDVDLRLAPSEDGQVLVAVQEGHADPVREQVDAHLHVLVEHLRNQRRQHRSTLTAEGQR